MQITQSITDLPTFPFATYNEFVEACGEGRAQVWVRADVGAAWRLGGWADRVGYLVLMGAGWVLAVVFVVLAYRSTMGGCCWARLLR